MMSHNMYVYMCFLHWRTMCWNKCLMFEYHPQKHRTTKKSDHVGPTNISAVSSRKRSVRLKKIKVFGEQTCIYYIYMCWFEGGKITSDFFLFQYCQYVVFTVTNKPDLYERQRKMPGGKTLSTPCEGEHGDEWPWFVCWVHQTWNLCIWNLCNGTHFGVIKLDANAWWCFRVFPNKLVHWLGW